MHLIAEFLESAEVEASQAPLKISRAVSHGAVRSAQCSVVEIASRTLPTDGTSEFVWGGKLHSGMLRSFMS